jgi:hypothetical protein
LEPPEKSPWNVQLQTLFLAELVLAAQPVALRLA